MAAVEEDTLPGAGAAAEKRVDDTPTYEEAVEALRGVPEEEGEAELWGFTRTDLETALKVIHALRNQPKLFLESPTLGVTGIQWLLNRKRMCVTDRAVWNSIDKAGNKNKKKERKYNDNQKLAQTKMRQEREEALRTLLECGDGSDATGKICSSSTTPVGTVASPLAITAPGAAAAEGEDEVKIEEKQEKAKPQIEGEDPNHLNFAAKCYTCKAAYHKVHKFYFALCPPCADLNYLKRNQTADLRGRTVLLTGSRIKIGQQICLSLLRCGATVIATTRFPADMSNRYSQLQDYEEWKDRLHVYRLDLRNLFLVTRFARFLKQKYKSLYAIVNNAAQTVARPQAYYANLLDTEEASLHTPALLYAKNVNQAWDESIRRAQGGIHADNCPTLLLGAPGARTESVSAAGPNTGTVVGTGKKEGDWQEGEWYDMYDTRQIARDRRTVNSWTQELHEIDGTEAAEVHAINALAPFILDSELRDLLRQPQPELGEDWEEWEKRPGQEQTEQPEQAEGEEGMPERTPTTAPSSAVMSPTSEASATSTGSKYARLKKGKAPKRKRFIINVSAMEGQFYRYKTAHHPHTNMAKASLNMLTRTAAAGYAVDGIYMNSVDTGWITDENPLGLAVERHKAGLQCPLDEIDAAARVLDLIYIESTEHGKFYKDYHEIPW